MLLASRFLSQEECQPCLPGYYCDAEGLAAPSGPCWEGFFCLEAADRPDPLLRDSRGGPCPEGDAVAESCERAIWIVWRKALRNTVLDNRIVIIL